MTLDAGSLMGGFAYATVGLALMFGLPAIASKIKGGLPLLGIAVAAGLFYAFDQGYIGN